MDKHEQARSLLAETLASFNHDSLAFIETLREKALLNLSIIDTPPEDDYDDIVHLATVICGTPTAAIMFLNKQDAWVKSVSNNDLPPRMVREQTFCNVAICDPKRTMVVNDALADSRFQNSPWVNGDLGKIRFYTGAPLVFDGVAVGALCVIDYVTREIDPEQVQNLEILARIVVKYLEQRQTTKSQ